MHEGWIVRSSWLFGATGTNFLLTMLRLGRERDEVGVVADQRGSPTYVGHLAAATRRIVELPHGLYHVAAEGDCTWADFAETIFDEAGLACRVRRITTAELGRPAPRPSYSVLRSEKPEHPDSPALARRPPRVPGPPRLDGPCQGDSPSDRSGTDISPLRAGDNGSRRHDRGSSLARTRRLGFGDARARHRRGRVHRLALRAPARGAGATTSSSSTG